MTPNPRFVELMSKMLDDAILDEELVELYGIVAEAPSLRSQFVDHLLLDTFLDENLGREPLTALVDLVDDAACSSIGKAPLLATQSKNSEASLYRKTRRRTRMSAWLVMAASLLILAWFITSNGNREAFASATQIVQAAMHTHAAPIERIYIVDVKRGETNNSRFEFPRDIRVATQGDRFWVQMRGYRDWAWGRNDQGSIWMTLGPKRAVVVNPEEMGVPLRHIGDLCTLHLETLLKNFLKHCRLEMSDGPADSTIIVATPHKQWSSRPLQRAMIEVDRETKAIRKLVIEREFERSSSIVTFTLVDSRLADESHYGPEGHLVEPYRIFSAETNAPRRRELINNWFGAISEQWMQIPETETK
jgi:hypothetical protein